MVEVPQLLGISIVEGHHLPDCRSFKGQGEDSNLGILSLEIPLIFLHIREDIHSKKPTCCRSPSYFTPRAVFHSSCGALTCPSTFAGTNAACGGFAGMVAGSAAQSAGSVATGPEVISFAQSVAAAASLPPSWQSSSPRPFRFSKDSIINRMICF